MLFPSAHIHHLGRARIQGPQRCGPFHLRRSKCLAEPSNQPPPRRRGLPTATRSIKALWLYSHIENVNGRYGIARSRWQVWMH